MAVIGYARCSTEEQSRDSNAIEAQAARLAAVAGEENVVKEFVSASKTPLRRRKVFLECIERLRNTPKGEDRILLVTRLDRLSRASEDLRMIRDLMNEGISFNSLDSGNAEPGAMGTFSLTMQIAMAEYEANLLSEKIGHRYADRRRDGEAMNNAPFGYRMKKVEGRMRWVLHPEEKEQAVRIYRSVINNSGVLTRVVKETADIEGMPRSIRGLQLWLTNPANLGHTVYRSGDASEDSPEYRYNTHDPLIDQETFQQVGELLAKRRTATIANPEHRKAPSHPLNGLLFCPSCGRAVTIKGQTRTCKGNGRGRYAGKRKEGEAITKYSAECRYIRMGRCDGFGDERPFGTVKVQELLDHVIDQLVSRSDALAAETIHESERTAIDPEERELMDALAGAKAKLGTITSDLLRKKAQRDVEEIEGMLEHHRQMNQDEGQRKPQLQKTLTAMDLTAEGFQDQPFDRQNRLLRTFVEKVTPAMGDSPAVVQLRV